MKIIIWLILPVFTFCSKLSAQCKSGDCENGKGVYDFGWCIYNGEFKDGKPNGTGEMKYDDYTYNGAFKDGVEDGRGTLTYKNGRTERVIYDRGTKLNAEPVKVAAADFKPLELKDPGCISGNCETGQGVYKDSRGNMYTGSFVNKARDGQGHIDYANGDVFEGRINNNNLASGTYKFNSGYSFTGTWQPDGQMYTGTYRAPNGRTVDQVNGKVIIPPPSSVIGDEYGNVKNQPSCQNWTSCPHCHGKGIISQPIVQNLSWSVGGISSVDSYGNRHTEYAGQSGSNSYSIPNYVVCKRCGGKGQICGK